MSNTETMADRLRGAADYLERLMREHPQADPELVSETRWQVADLRHAADELS